MRNRFLAIMLVCALSVAVLVASASAATAPVVQEVDSSNFPKVSLTLLLQPGMLPAAGRAPEVFVTENGEDISDVLVGRFETERVPIDVVLTIDTSGSMRGAPLDDAISAAHNFVDTLEPEDSVALVAFSSDPLVVQGFTTDRALLHSALDKLASGGETALYDGLVTAATVANQGTADEQYIIVLSDGGDTTSVNSANNATKAVKESGATVFAVVLESPEYDPKPLRSITKATAGRMVTTSDSEELESIYTLIAEELGLRYRVEFTSTRPNTVDLEYSVSIGSSGDAPATKVAVQNPAHRPDFGSGEAAMVIPTDDSARLLIIGVLISASIFLVAAAIGLYIVRERPALDLLDFYGQEEAVVAAPQEPASQSRSAIATGYETIRETLIGVLGDAVERRGFTGKIQRRLDLAGVALRASEFVYILVLGSLVFTLGLWSATQSVGGIVLGVLASVGTPILILKIAASRRLNKFQAQLPAIMDLLSGSLRSGWGLQQAVDLVVDEVDEPARSHFRRAQIESRLGLPFDEALQRLALRVESPDLQWAVNAITIQREVGGNLAEVLGIVSKTMRERTELKQEIKSLTAETRLSTIILSIIPFGMFVYIFFTSRDLVVAALESPIGIGGYALAVLLFIIGITWMLRVSKIDV